MTILQLTDVTKQFGGLVAVNGVNLSLEKGELVGLIGPNGAGKTTVFNLLTGVYTPTKGQIEFEGKSIIGLKSYQIAHRGVSRTFQNIRLFPEMTVLDNIKTACFGHIKTGLAAAIFQTPASQRSENEIDQQARVLVERFNLGKYICETAKSLPYGEQRRLEIARALATKPRLLLLDEPAAGMNPQEKLELMDRIKALPAEFDVTILLIEHDMRLVMGACERILVLDYGQIIAEGTPNEIQSNPRVIEAYLGDATSL